MQQMNRAAVLIQKYYRRYRNSLARSKELERAALFIQQMYRYDIIILHNDYIDILIFGLSFYLYVLL